MESSISAKIRLVTRCTAPSPNGARMRCASTISCLRLEHQRIENGETAIKVMMTMLNSAEMVWWDDLMLWAKKGGEDQVQQECFSIVGC
mmetsp:Transcript_8168/g.17605  ORF Transcript_8168/g.17605 Transcript_8168/m.17605 type:complete len:89 (-) Transcript_8168:699-965(-)